MSDELLRDASGKVRMLEVAKAAGVSRSTVSNVMRGYPTVGEEVRLRVLEHANRLGYVYDRGAASLRMRRSNLVGLVIPDMANPFIAQTVRGAHETLASHGFLVTTIETGDDWERQSLVLRSLAEHRVDGFLLLPAVHTDPTSLLAALGDLKTVILNRDIHAPGLPYVGPDEEAVATIGASHLIDVHSCSTVAYFGGPAAAAPRNTRSETFTDLAIRMGARLAADWNIASDSAASSAYAIARRILASGAPLPEGIMCHSDTVAYGLLRALREGGVEPGRCHVLGCDDLPESDFWNPRLTTVSVDSATIGRTAAELLLQNLGKSEASGNASEPHLVVRESCGCLPRSR